MSFAISIEKQQQAVKLTNKLHANYGKKFLSDILPPLQTLLPVALWDYNSVYIKGLLC